MTERYLTYALISFFAYSLVAPLIKIAMVHLPSTPAVFMSNFVLLVVVGGVLRVQGESPVPYLRHRYTPLMVVSGLLLTVGLLTYYRSLELGPVSVVVPIFGLFIVVSSAVGVAALGEELTRRRLAGVVLSVVAIVLISR